MNWFQTKKYLGYLVISRHRKGFGIHSPFVFDLVANLMCEKYDYYSFAKIRSWRKALTGNSNLIEVSDFGAGSTLTNSNKRKVGDIVAHGGIPEKYGELLFRMVNQFSPDGILELGTSAGVSTSYLALPKRATKVVTIEGCPNRATLAQNTFRFFNLVNVELLTGKFVEQLPEAIKQLPSLDFVFFDGDHRKKPTLAYFSECLRHVHNDTVFIFDDIHWSAGMEEAWNEIIAHTSVTVSIDIFRLGIVFFKKELQKQHYIVRF
ncbi:MAG: class I SAM-dependent methyltransferase [Cytophagaceae bacterium]|jgi:predicted O-methyltransferase YrrM|nr:class I SAM-dependent methyltransferase [Cytophagaceae bacterium]